MLFTFGGDGETAVRLVRSAQSRCKELTVIVPDIAKSAGTIMVLGAHHIIMGPTSDLGPIDPQFELKPGSLVSAKDIIAAVDDAAQRIQNAPQTYPLYASLLSDVTAITVQQARSALERTADLMEEALRSNADRTDAQVSGLMKTLKGPLVDSPKTHTAVFGAKAASDAGLPVTQLDSTTPQWKKIWRLWARYLAMNSRFYEGSRASQVFPWQQPTTTR